MSPRSLVALALLVAAALGSWYLARVNTAEDDRQPIMDPVHRGFYLKSARILGTAVDGGPLYEIRAERAEEQHDGSIEFTDVRFDYSPETDVPWSVDADTARILPQQQRVQLSGHVRAFSEQPDGDTEIRTQYLELDPERYIAETDARVQIRIGSRSLTATGMLASLNENRLELKTNVSGKFVP